MTLTDFLLARITEDEALTRGEVPETAWGKGAIIPNDPRRVLAECEVKRRIVEWHEADAICVTHNQHWVDGCPECFAAQQMPIVGALMCSYLADVYADHPDYREEWKP